MEEIDTGLNQYQGKTWQPSSEDQTFHKKKKMLEYSNMAQGAKKIRTISTVNKSAKFYSDENANFRKTLYQHSYARFEGSKSNKHNL